MVTRPKKSSCCERAKLVTTDFNIPKPVWDAYIGISAPNQGLANLAMHQLQLAVYILDHPDGTLFTKMSEEDTFRLTPDSLADFYADHGVDNPFEVFAYKLYMKAIKLDRSHGAVHVAVAALRTLACLADWDFCLRPERGYSLGQG